jgi:hypothetical protein
MDEAELKAKLRKIEALFAGAATAGERAAAGAAAERIKMRLEETSAKEVSIETRFKLRDPWTHHLFIALCRRYGLRPYRYRGMRRTNLCVKAPRSFIGSVLWPEFQQLEQVLVQHMWDITDRIIQEEMFSEAGDADEIDAPLAIAKV